MEFARLVDLTAFLAYFEIFCKSGKKFSRSKSVEVLHDAVVVDDLELAVREGNRHEIVVLLLSCMVRILGLLLCSHKGCRGGTVVAVSYIECWNLCKDLCYAVDVSLFVDHPEMVSEAVLGNEIILCFLCDITCYDGVHLFIVRI